MNTRCVFHAYLLVIRENGVSSCYFPAKSTARITDLIYHPGNALVLLSLYHASPRNVKIEPRACQSVTPAMLPSSPDMHTRVRISKRMYMRVYMGRECKICTTRTTSGCHRDANVHFHPVEPRMSRHINALVINTFNRDSIIATPEPSTNSFLRRTLL